jgi:NAD(P)-dependent dehydrogenase (short-subunit alcohol dehydrogenase family)
VSLKQQRVVVIGGTSGIGLAVAQVALADGASVIVGSSSAAKVRAAQEQLAGAEALAVDVKDEASVEAFFARVDALDHLVFTAGDWAMAGGGPIASLDVAGATSQFAVRFWGALTCVKHAVKRIREGGSITLTDGTIAHRPRKGAALSSAMAGAVEHLGRALALDLAPIRVNVVCPGAIRTGVWDMIPPDQREERFQTMFKRLPAKRIGEPSEVAEAYLYLMRGGYTTGQVLHVDGGAMVI